MKGSAVLLSMLVLFALDVCGRWAHCAHADTPPSVWDIARDPVRNDTWGLHVRVERLLHPSVPDELSPLELRRDQELRLEAVRAMLEQADAAHSPDLRLRFDLAAVYEQLATDQGRADLHRRVVDLVAPALDATPDHPAATGALETLVYAYAKLDRPAEELAAWQRLLPRLADDRARLAPMMNMGEAEMRLGRLEDAAATFSDVLHLCEMLPNSSSVNATFALTLWDLAVTLDRAGDPRTAIKTAARAKGWRWSSPAPYGQVRAVTGWDVILDLREVFFVPDWEREWYLALGYAADADEGSDPRLAASSWARAEEHWASYAEHATHAGGQERWLSTARARRDRAHAERVAAERRAVRQKPAPGQPWVVE
ncbi:MAG: tetratricopeptide repeat protein [Myxococcota bacterium]|nr:tetratricopeptide repeat protein [Myxococcota bacterium]